MKRLMVMLLAAMLAAGCVNLGSMGAGGPAKAATNATTAGGSPASAGTAAAASQMILDTTNNYLGGCALTDTSTWTSDSDMQVARLQVWYSWNTGETTVAYTLKKDGADFSSGTFTRAECDPYQAQWCNGNFDINREFPAGNYELKVANARMCLKPGATGTVRLYGTVTGAKASNNAPPALASCTYSGNWNTDWGTMTLVQTGSTVSGNYTWDSGRISGTVSNGKFIGKWSESPTYSEPDDAGDAEFEFTTDCNSFTGNWRYGTGGAGAAWSGTWVGTKVS